MKDGRKIRPLGIVMEQPEALKPLIALQQPIWENREIMLAQLASSPDRWGRHSSWAAAPSIMAGLDPLSLTIALLQDGIGFADPAEVPVSCRRALLKAEAEARRSKRGLWHDAQSVVLNANAPREGFKKKQGHFAIMEGRVLRVGEGRQRNFIDFGARGSGAASAAILRRNMAMVLPSGVKLADLKGKRLRLRGVVEWQTDRPFMLLERAAMIEVLD